MKFYCFFEIGEEPEKIKKTPKLFLGSETIFVTPSLKLRRTVLFLGVSKNS